MVRGATCAAMLQACRALVAISFPQALRLPVAQMQELAGIDDPQLLAPNSRQHFHPSQLVAAHPCPPQSDLLSEVVLGDISILEKRGHYYRGATDKIPLVSNQNRNVPFLTKIETSPFSVLLLLCRRCRILEARVKKILWLLAFGIFATGSVASAETTKAQTVQYLSGNETVSGYLVTPTTSGKHPAIIVIHEWWGLNDWIREQARKFGDSGYVTLAGDLYRGKSTDDPTEAHELSRGVCPRIEGSRA